MLWELSHFNGFTAKRRALNRAFGSVPGALLAMIVALAIWSVLAYCLCVLCVSTYGVPEPVATLGAAPLIFIGSVTTVLRLFRRRMRMNLILQLEEQGILLCRTCGYNLYGIESTLCPECGSPRENTPSPRFTTTRLLLVIVLLWSLVSVFILAPWSIYTGHFETRHVIAFFWWIVVGWLSFRGLCPARGKRRRLVSGSLEEKKG